MHAIDTSKTMRTVYTPNDVATYTMDEIERRVKEKDRVVSTGIAALDADMKPVLPGEMVFVMAYTSNGKTSFMQAWARNAVKCLQNRDRLDEVVVFITWETLVEELGLYDLCGMTGLDASSIWYGDVTEPDMARLRVASMKRMAMPLWVMGYSLKRRREDKITMRVVSENLKQLEEGHGIRPAMIFLDYVQRIDPESWRDERRVQVLKIVDGIQNLARDCGCPVVTGCQAGRQVMERDFKLPEIGEGQETSRIEQDADKVLSLWYPCKSEPLGSVLPGTENDPNPVLVTDDLMVTCVRKQRHGASGQINLLRFDAARNTFTSWGA